ETYSPGVLERRAKAVIFPGKAARSAAAGSEDEGWSACAETVRCGRKPEGFQRSRKDMPSFGLNGTDFRRHDSRIGVAARLRGHEPEVLPVGNGDIALLGKRLVPAAGILAGDGCRAIGRDK